MSAPEAADGNWLTGYWRDRRLPLVPGIFHADGRIVPMHVSCTALPEPGRYAFDIGRGRERRIAELGGMTEELGSMIMLEEWAAVDSKRNLSAYCGEGSWGGDGYVALVHTDSDKPIWIAFFDESNPFVSVALTADTVVAVSNHGNRWTFPIGSPESVTVD